MNSASVHDDYVKRQWYVAATQPNKERFAIENLQRQGFNTFYPRMKRARHRKNRIESVVEGLFPGYVFVNFDRDRDRWQAINGTFGVRTLVGVRGSEPAPVPQRAMRALLDRCPDELWCEDSAGLAQGDRVELIDGPFAGGIAEFEAMLPGDRVCVLLAWLGTQRSVVMPASYIMAAAQ